MATEENLKPENNKILNEALELSSEILKNVEMSEISLTNCILKSSRLARLLNDFEMQKVFQFEIGGYPFTPSGVTPEIWALLKKAGRIRKVKDHKYKDGTIEHFEKEVADTIGIEGLIEQIEGAKITLKATVDPNVSISSANPNQMVLTPIGNKLERDKLRGEISTNNSLLAKRRAFIYSYVLEKNIELRFANVTNNIFLKYMMKVDDNIVKLIPDAVKKLTAIHENLNSSNNEDWSNAANSCRRMIQDVADTIQPFDEKKQEILKNGKTIKLGKENYINRIITFIEQNSDSQTFKEISGSHLRFIGEKLDSLYEASNKGLHKSISKDEAERTFILAFILIGDILSLIELKDRT